MFSCCWYGVDNIFGYFWSGDSGTIHFLAVADEDVFNTFKPDIFDILNGLVIVRR